MKLDRGKILKSMAFLNAIATNLLGDAVQCEDEVLRTAIILEYDALDVALECMKKVSEELK